MKWERLTDIVLCGHSYGGMVISGVAEQMPSAIRSIVFLDAFVPRDGESTQYLTSTAVQEGIRAALQRGDLGMPPRPAEAFRVNEASGKPRLVYMHISRNTFLEIQASGPQRPAGVTHYGLVVGLVWWIIGMALAGIYFAVIYNLFRGKVHLEEPGY